MNQKQINSLNMQEGILAHFDNNLSVWQNIKPIARDVAILRLIVKASKETALIQQANATQGYTAKKDEALDKILDQTLKIILQVKDYAIEKNNAVLRAAVNFTESSLAEGAEREIINRCEIIIKKVQENTTDLVAEGYDITAAGLSALLADIEAQKKLSPERDVVGGTRTSATASLPELDRKGRGLLKKMDGLVNSMIKDDAFIDIYENLRYTNDRRGGRGKNTPPPPIA